MHLNILHLDDALAGQTAFLDACSKLEANQVNLRSEGPEARLWGRTEVLHKLSARLCVELRGLSSNQPIVTWIGSGDFHHVTALIVSLLAKAREVPVTIVHIDNHPDWVRFPIGIHCGSWVSHVLENGMVERVVSLGVSSHDLAWPELKGADLSLVASKRLVVFPLDPPLTRVVKDYGAGPAHSCGQHRITWKQISNAPDEAALSAVLDTINTKHIYITIDKDALTNTDAQTNWDHGGFSLDGLLTWLRALMAERDVVGLDIVGDYSPVACGGSRLDRFWKWSESLLDQPFSVIPVEIAARTNERSNLKILKTLEEQLC